MLSPSKLFIAFHFLIAANLLILFQIDTSGLCFVKTDRCIIKFPPKLHTRPCHCFMYYWGIWICYNLGGGGKRLESWFSEWKGFVIWKWLFWLRVAWWDASWHSEGGLGLCAHPWGVIVLQFSWKPAVEGTIKSLGLAFLSINHLLKEKAEG